MKKTIIFCIFLMHFCSTNSFGQPACTGQSGVGGAPAGDTFPGCTICDLSGVYMGNNGGYNPTMSFSCGIEHNDAFVSFIADNTGTISVTLISSNCQNAEGLQLILWDQLGNELDCFSVGGALIATSTVNNVIPGDLYTIMVDGFNFDVCDYTIVVTGYSTTPLAPTSPIVAMPNNSNYCIGDTIEYSINPVLGTTMYNWVIPQAATIISGGGLSDTNVVVETTNLGGGAVTITPSNGCFTGTTEVIPIIVLPGPNVQWDPIIICNEDLPWDTTVCGQFFETFSFGSFEIVCNSGGCDTTYFFDVDPLPQTVGIIDTAICDGECLFIEGICYDTPGVYNITLMNSSQSNGCDSLVELFLDVIFVDSEFDVDEDELCFGETGMVNYFGNSSLSANFNWDFGNATVLTGSGPGPYELEFPSAGIYPISLTVEEFGCISMPTTETIEVSDTLLALNLSCTATMDEVVFTWDSDPNVLFYNFFVVTNQIGFQNGDSYIIQNLSPNEVVELEVEAVSIFDCPEVIEAKSCTTLSCPVLTSDFSAESPICILESSTIEFLGNASPNATFNWDFGNAIINSGTGAGPYEISYQDPGTYPISLMLDDNGCVSTITTENVTVEPNADPFNVTCTSGINEVVFNWTNASNILNYTFVITTGQAGIMNGNMVTVSNLMPNELVGIEVTGVSLFDCDDYVATAGCSALPCPVISSDFTVDSPKCQSETTTVTYTGNAPANATYNWDFGTANVVGGTGAGPYVINFSNAGTFNISLSVVDGFCSSPLTTNSVVINPELLPLNLTCTSTIDEVTFNWTPDPSVSSYNFSVLTGQVGTQTGNTYVVSNLTPTETVTLQLTANSNFNCSPIMDEQTCTAQDCPAVTVTIDPVSDICLTPATQTIQLTGQAGNNMGAFLWTGTGVSPSGLFNPVVAGVGNHVITLKYTDGNCEYSETTIIKINQTPTADFNVNTPICISNNATITYAGNATVAANYNWSFDGGTILSGTNSGPYEVSYSTEGTKTLSLTVEENGCTSNTVQQNIEVQTELGLPLINCTSTRTSVTFQWNPVPGAVSYQVNVLSGQSGVLNGTTYIVSSLNPGDEVSIELTVVGNTACGNVSVAQTCVAQNCPIYSVNIEPIPNICLTPSIQPVQLNATTTGGSGTFVFSGNGVSPNGVFDPTIAGVGTHSIEVVFTEGTCRYSATTEVVVSQTPTANFTVASPICQNESSMVNYTGNASNSANFNWNFGTGTVATGSNSGPYEVSFDNVGIETISLIVEENGCTSNTESNSLQVDQLLMEPVISCQNTMLNEVSFEWDNDPNILDYQVQVSSGQTGTLNGNVYTVSGLSPGEIVSITVTGNSANSCPSVSSSATCESIFCPPIDLTIAPLQDVICAGDSTIVQLVANNNGQTQLGTYTWTGTNVSPNGEFNTAGLMAGEFQVGVEYNEMGCIYSSTQIISIEATPELNATVNSPIWFLGGTGSIDLEIMNGTPPYDTAFSSQGTTINQLDSLSPGEYTISAVDQNGCYVEENFTISEGVYKVQPIHIICSGDVQPLTVTPATGASFSWTPPIRLSCVDCPSPLSNPRRSTQYTVTATLPDGRFASQIVTVIVLPSIVCNGISPDDEVLTKLLSDFDFEKIGENDLEEIDKRILDYFSKKEVKIAPNPTDGIVNILTPAKVESVDVFDFSGKRMMTTFEKEIDLSKMAKGIYFFKIKVENEVIVRRVVLI